MSSGLTTTSFCPRTRNWIFREMTSAVIVRAVILKYKITDTTSLPLQILLPIIVFFYIVAQQLTFANLFSVFSLLRCHVHMTSVRGGRFSQILTKRKEVA